MLSSAHPSTNAQIYQTLREPIPRAIPLNVPKPLSEKITAEFGDIPANPTISGLNALFKKMNEHLDNPKENERKKLILEQYKLALMQAVLAYVDQLNETPKIPEKKEDKKLFGFVPEKYSPWLKGGFLFLISAVGMVEASIEVFLGAKLLLLGLIPLIAPQVLLISCIAITVIACIQFIGFEVWMLQNLFGFSNDSLAKQRMGCHEEQIKLTDLINKRLLTPSIPHQLSPADYLLLTNTVKRFNNDIEEKKSKYKKYEESFSRKAARWSLTGIGALLTGVGSYFGAYSFLAAVAAPLLGTPLGWAFSAALIMSALVFYFAMEGEGFSHLFDSGSKEFKKVQQQLDPFITHRSYYEKQYDALYQHGAYVPKKSRQIQTLDLAYPSALIFVRHHPEEKEAGENSISSVPSY